MGVRGRENVQSHCVATVTLKVCFTQVKEQKKHKNDTTSVSYQTSFANEFITT